MSKLRSTQTLPPTKNKKAATTFTPKKKILEKTPRPKVSRVIIVARPINDDLTAFAIMNTQIITEDLPDSTENFNLVVVLSPVAEAQPVQNPPFEHSFSVITQPGSQAAILLGPPLSFIDGSEPTFSAGEYLVSLIQNGETGTVWDVSDAEVDIIYGDPLMNNKTHTASPELVVSSDDKTPRPKVSRVVIIKKPINEDDDTSVKVDVNVEATELPTGVTSFSLDITLTANTGQPSQVTPTTESFSMDDGVLKGSLNFSSDDFITGQSNPYTITLVENTGDSEDWDISSATVEIHTE